MNISFFNKTITILAEISWEVLLATKKEIKNRRDEDKSIEDGNEEIKCESLV